MSSAGTESPVTETISLYSDLERTLFQAILGLLAAVGGIGNLLIIFVVLTFRRWRVPTNIILCNVAIADLFICCWTLPVHIICIKSDWWPMPIWLCSLSGFLDNASYACSAWSLTFGSIERFYVVVSQGRNRQKISSSITIVICGMIWICSTIIAVLPVLGWNRYVYSPITSTCGFDGSQRGVHEYYFVLFLLLVLTAPLVIIVFSYSYVFIAVAKMPNRNAKERRSHLKVAIPLLIITLAFLLTFLPPTVILAIIVFAPRALNLSHLQYYIIHWVLLLGSCVNPMLCAFLSKKFRGACKQLLVCLGHCLLDIVRQLASCDRESLAQIRYCIQYYLEDANRRIRKSMKTTRKAIVSRLCPRVFRSDSDNFVIKVTITNYQSEVSMNPLLSAMAPAELTQTQLSSVVNSKDGHDFLNSQNSPISNQGILDRIPHRTKQTSAERFLPDIVNEVITEEVEPIVAMCTCGLRRCTCELAATPV